ncbi:MAG: class I SAM-dependent methyltransferase [Methanomicrobiales archaeon]|nr:class I SAM-dependent methyltransferase [Methanomicrobiales archaeon]
MTGTGSLQALRDMTASREEFLLSEFAARFYPGIELPVLLTTLLPALSRLRLGWETRGSSDFRIFSLPAQAPFLLPRETVTMMEARLSTGIFDDDLQNLIERYIVQVTGKDWDDPVVLQRIRSAIMQQKGQYWKEGKARKIGYRKGYAVLAYLAYHTPVYVTQSAHLLLMLTRDRLLPARARILDAGTGPGVFPLAATWFARTMPGFSAEIFSLERSDPFIEAYRFLAPRYSAGMDSLTIHPPIQGDLRETDTLLLPSSLDLIVLQNVLNEFPGTPGDKAAIVTSLSRLLAPGGCLLITEPADRESSTGLRITVAAALGPDLRIHSPCSFIRGRQCRPDNCWSFVVRPSLRPTRLMQRLSGEHEAYRFENTDIKYSYAVLVRDSRRRHPYTVPGNAPFLPFSALPRHTGKRVNVVGAVMSADIGDAGTHVFLLCDGTQSRPVYAVLPRYHCTPDNRYLLTASYSSLVELRQVLVRYNQKHQAWNLFVSRTTQVLAAEPEGNAPGQ